MNQKEMERIAFLYLCGNRDRELLLEKEKMTFADFDRLLYITDLIGFSELNLEIWETYNAQFRKQFRELERLFLDSTEGIGWNLTERGDDTSAEWIADFYGQIPDQKSKKVVEKWIQEKSA